MKQVTAWQCEYCNMVSLYPGNVRRHERKTCQKAPGACGTCALFSVVEETVYNPNHGGDPGSTDYERDVPWCDILGELIARLAGCGYWKEQGK